MKSYLDGSGLQYILNKIKGVLTSHTHGNITSDGKLQTTDVAIAKGDKIVITDASDSNKVARASILFNGSTTTKALSQKGTWENFESTSNKVTSLSSSSTNDEYPSAKAVYDAIISNLDKVPLVSGTAAASVTIEPYKIYNFGTLSMSMTIAFDTSKEVSGYCAEYCFRFVAGSGCSITLPSSVKNSAGSMPVYVTGRSYEFDIVDNLCVIGEFY